VDVRIYQAGQNVFPARRVNVVSGPKAKFGRRTDFGYAVAGDDHGVVRKHPAERIHRNDQAVTDDSASHFGWPVIRESRSQDGNATPVPADGEALGKGR